jgi:FlaG/FlaF family flagellin (archaellin)
MKQLIQLKRLAVTIAAVVAVLIGGAAQHALASPAAATPAASSSGSVMRTSVRVDAAAPLPANCMPSVSCHDSSWGG